MSTHTVFEIFVALHIVTGSVGLVSFWVPVAGRKGGPAREEVFGGGGKGLEAFAVIGDGFGHARRYGETVFGQLDCGREQISPVGLAPSPVRVFHQFWCTRCADR